jgi:curved DNA-binding protein CbpA
MTGGTHYDTLGVPPNATSAEIREAFAQRMEAGSPLAEQNALTEAFDVLTDPQRRAGYDWRLGIDDLQPLDWGGARPEPHALAVRLAGGRQRWPFGWVSTLGLRRQKRSRRM